MEAIQAATTGVADLFMRPHELGRVLPGYYADLILVDGDPLEDIKILQDHSKLNMILINGRIHKKDTASSAKVRDIIRTVRSYADRSFSSPASSL
jgi:imidazolonepropionase-like amidohydrolase